jgi:uncharacterized protein (TIGR03086 family)
MSDDNPVIATYRRIADAFSVRVDGTPSDRWSSVSPCEGWTARDVVAHVVDSARRLAGNETTMGADEDPAAAWASAKAAVLAKLSEPGALDEVLPGPFGPMPRGQMVQRLMVNDILVHTWDLARATGQDETLDADAVAHAYSGLKPLDAMIRMPGVFGPKVEAPEGADLQTEFLCFLGRPAA